jgi:hypothetical protein
MKINELNEAGVPHLPAPRGTHLPAVVKPTPVSTQVNAPKKVDPNVIDVKAKEVFPVTAKPGTAATPKASTTAATPNYGTGVGPGVKPQMTATPKVDIKAQNAAAAERGNAGRGNVQRDLDGRPINQPVPPAAKKPMGVGTTAALGAAVGLPLVLGGASVMLGNNEKKSSTQSDPRDLEKGMSRGTRPPQTSAATDSQPGTGNKPQNSGYKGSMGAQSLMALNPDKIKNVNKIKAGDSIDLGGGNMYKIQKGDTLDKIAQRMTKPSGQQTNNPAPAPVAPAPVAPAPVAPAPETQAATTQNRPGGYQGPIGDNIPNDPLPAPAPVLGTPENPYPQGAEVKSGSGETWKTSDGSALRTRSDAEIGDTNPRTGVVTPGSYDKQRAQGEKNLQGLKNFFGFGKKEEPTQSATTPANNQSSGHTGSSSGSGSPMSGVKPADRTFESNIELNRIRKLSGLSQLTEAPVAPVAPPAPTTATNASSLRAMQNNAGAKTGTTTTTPTTPASNPAVTSAGASGPPGSFQRGAGIAAATAALPKATPNPAVTAQGASGPPGSFKRGDGIRAATVGGGRGGQGGPTAAQMASANQATQAATTAGSKIVKPAMPAGPAVGSQAQTAAGKNELAKTGIMGGQPAPAQAATTTPPAGSGSPMAGVNTRPAGGYGNFTSGSTATTPPTGSGSPMAGVGNASSLRTALNAAGSQTGTTTGPAPASNLQAQSTAPTGPGSPMAGVKSPAPTTQAATTTGSGSPLKGVQTSNPNAKDYDADVAEFERDVADMNGQGAQPNQGGPETQATRDFEESIMRESTMELNQLRKFSGLPELTESEVTVHKGTYGNSYGKEDVRDQYGHKIGKVDKGSEAKKDAPKRGRGRPTKGDKDEHGNDTKFDTSGLQGMLGGKPKGEVGKKSVKHSLKDWMEVVSDNIINEAEEQVDEGFNFSSAAKAAGKTPHRPHPKELEMDATVRSMQIQNRADAAEKTLAQRAAEPKNIGQKIARDIGDPLKQLAKGDVKGALFDPPSSLTKDVKEGEQRMSRAAKGHEKYGKKGMQALAKAGRDGASKKKLDTIRNKYDKYNNKKVDEGFDLSSVGHETLDSQYDPEMQERIKNSTPQELSQMAYELAGDPSRYAYEYKKLEAARSLLRGTTKHDESIQEGDNEPKKTANTPLEPRKPSETFKQAQRNHYGAKRMEEAKDLPGDQDDLDVAPPKGKLTKADFEALRKKKKVSEARVVEESEYTYEKIGKILAQENPTLSSDSNEFIQAVYDEMIQLGMTPRSAQNKLSYDEDFLGEVVTSFHHYLDKNTVDEAAMPKGMGQTPPYMPPKKPENGMGRIVQGTWQSDPRGTVKAPSGDPEGVKEAGSFIRNLASTRRAFEGKNMKDIQLESWDKELNSLLSENLTISTTIDDQGHDSVNVSATEGNAHEIIELLRNAGLGGLGGGKQEHGPEVNNYGLPMSNDEHHGPEAQLIAVGNPHAHSEMGDEGGDDMMSLIKKMTGIEDSGEQDSQDYEHEEGNEEHNHEDGECEECGESPCACDDEQEVDEGQDFGPGRSGPNKNLPGPAYSFSPDTNNYKTPNLDRNAEIDKKGYMQDWNKEIVNTTMGPDTRGNQAHIGAYTADGQGQTKYVDRTAPGIVNKIKDKLGYDMPDPAYGPRPDERERLAKRYPAPVKEQEVEEGNFYAHNVLKAKAAGQEEADLDGDGDMEKVKEGYGPCNECGETMYERHSCGSEPLMEPLEEYANDADDTATQDIAYMMRTLSGGGGMGEKRSQATMPVVKIVTAEGTLMKDSTDLLSDFRKLSGI